MNGDRLTGRQRRQVVWMCAAFQLCMGMHSALKGIVLPMIIQAHGISYTLSGMLLTSSTVGYLAGSLLCERLGVTLGRMRVLLLSLGVMAATSALIALNGAVALYIPLFMLSGICYGAVECLTTAVIQYWCPEDADALVSTAFSAYCPGAALGALLTGLLWLAGASWQLSYWACGGICLGCLAACARVRLPDDRGGRQTGYSLRGIGALRSYPLFLLGCAGMFLFSGAENASYSWLPTFFKTGADQSFWATCLLSMELYAAIFLGRLVFARLTKRVNGSVLAVASCLAAMLVLWNLGHIRTYVAAIAVFGIAMSSIYPLLISTVSRLCAHPLTYSVLFLAVGIGNLSVNSSMGGIADRFGVGGSLRFCGILLLLVAMVTSVVGFKGSGGRRDRHAA